MRKTRFAEMVSAIDKKDHKRFTELVDSPYFNKNERVKKLWRYIIQTPKAEYTIEELRTASGGYINDANFRMVLSDFVKLAEIFLLLEAGDLIEGQRDELIDILKEKNLAKGYSKHMRLLKEKAANTDYKDVSYYNNLYFIECEKLVNDEQKNKGRRLEEINRLTDLGWLSMKLDGFIRSCLLGGDVSGMSFYSEIMALAEKNTALFKKGHSVIYSRWLILKMFTETDGVNYFKELEQYTAKLKSRSLQNENYDAMLTYCILKGEHKKGYQLVKMLKSKGLAVEENGQIPPARLELFVNTALASGHLAEMERWKKN